MYRVTGKETIAWHVYLHLVLASPFFLCGLALSIAGLIYPPWRPMVYFGGVLLLFSAPNFLITGLRVLRQRVLKCDFFQARYCAKDKRLLNADQLPPAWH